MTGVRSLDSPGADFGGGRAGHVLQLSLAWVTTRAQTCTYRCVYGSLSRPLKSLHSGCVRVTAPRK